MTDIETYMRLDPDKHTAKFLMQTADYLKTKKVKDCYEVRILTPKTVAVLHIEADKRRIDSIRLNMPMSIDIITSTQPFIKHAQKYLASKNINRCHELRIFIIRSRDGGYTDTIRVTADKKIIGEDFRVPYNKGTTLENIKYG